MEVCFLTGRPRSGGDGYAGLQAPVVLPTGWVPWSKCFGLRPVHHQPWFSLLHNFSWRNYLYNMLLFFHMYTLKLFELSIKTQLCLICKTTGLSGFGQVSSLCKGMLRRSVCNCFRLHTSLAGTSFNH